MIKLHTPVAYTHPSLATHHNIRLPPATSPPSAKINLCGCTRIFAGAQPNLLNDFNLSMAQKGFTAKLHWLIYVAGWKCKLITLLMLPMQFGSDGRGRMVAWIHKFNVSYASRGVMYLCIPPSSTIDLNRVGNIKSMIYLCFNARLDN
jgi:hypothetical protein